MASYWVREICMFFVLCFFCLMWEHTHTSLPEVLKVLLDVREQRVLKCLNMLSVYFLWDQLCSPPFCRHMHIHSDTLYTKHQGAVAWADIRTKAWHSKPLISLAHKMISLMSAKTQNDIVQTTKWSTIVAWHTYQDQQRWIQEQQLSNSAAKGKWSENC